MKIGVMHWAFPPVVGGVESHLIYLYEELTRMGHKVAFLTSPHPERDEGDYPWCKIVSDDYMSIRYCLGEAGAERRMRVYEMMERFIAGEEPDIVHAHNFHYFVPDHALCLGALSRKYGLPIVLTIHNYWEDDLCRRLLRDVGWDRIVAVSYHIKRPCIFDAGVPPDRVEVHYHGVRLDRYRMVGDREALKERLGLKGRRVVLHPARACQSKGSLHSIMAIAMLKEKYRDVCLLLSGSGDSVDFDNERESFKSEAASLIERLGVEDNVVFINARGDEMPLYMNAADVVIYPTVLPQGEAFGIAPVEAMACGRPVIVTDSGGLAESTSHGINGLVIERDPDTLAKRLSKGIDLLLSDVELAEYLGRNGREIAVERFDSRKMALKMERLYHRLVSGHVTRGSVRVDASAARPLS
ncbi:glycosyltransferase family 4 protein [Methanocella conradii]|uniref:glycosyltransferase family 4 protein n=1 Tax=Methanocella conradii TaxID=1175444 RepID=UPI0024B39BB1|nr:glycosyltransferase family 4 protein [Methanocella conradii]MDI6897323.1 glycosyltransferase family 4 protein [Methanocella conradii]